MIRQFSHVRDAYAVAEGTNLNFDELMQKFQMNHMFLISPLHGINSKLTPKRSSW